jgi:hypothetical protein
VGESSGGEEAGDLGAAAGGEEHAKVVKAEGGVVAESLEAGFVEEDDAVAGRGRDLKRAPMPKR